MTIADSCSVCVNMCVLLVRKRLQAEAEAEWMKLQEHQEAVVSMLV